MALLMSLCPPAPAQFASSNVKLKAKTVSEFQSYTQEVEAELTARWHARKPFLQLDEDQPERQKVLNGELLVRAELDKNPRSISDGLIHDWYGAVYMPNTTIDRVLSVLQDYDHHASIYPQVIQSRLIKRVGDDITGYWRIEEKGQVFPAVFDITQTSHYEKISPDKWCQISHANNIQSVEKSKALPVGEGNGFMWKLYSYWTIEKVGNGVIGECRSISLSRGVPGAVAWMLRPFLNSIPRDTMDSTLRSTRRASGE